MRRDLIIGILCSILLHGGLAISGNIPNPFAAKKKVSKDDIATIQLEELPKMEPEEPDAPEETETVAETLTAPPPSLVDVPSAVSYGDIVQQVQPPPAPKADLSRAAPRNIGAQQANLKEIFDLKNLDQQPVMRGEPRINYPFDMKNQGVSGDVIVEFICDENGNVSEPRVIKSSRPEFEANAIEAVLRLKFRPGRKGGKNVTCRMKLPITFNIEDAQ